MKELLLKKYHCWNFEKIPVGFSFDLQQFAKSEDEGRTEEPTEKKLREAREKGQVAKTQELSQAVVVIFGFLVIFFFASLIYSSLEAMTKYYLSSFADHTLTLRSISRDFVAIIFQCGKILLPLFIATIVAALIGEMSQVGFQMSSHPLKLDWSKIKFDPATILKKTFFSKQIAMNLFKSIFKVLVVGVISYLIISNDFEEILKTSDIAITAALKTILIVGLKIIIWSSVLMLILSIPDYIFQKKEFIESLKMSKEEMKEELKETMGDPHMRARLKEMQREIVMKNMISEVPKADVVVTNPTHFAVALKYDRNTMESPTVIAKGLDSMALKIREIAKENLISIIENRPLAQEMYNRLEVGDIIPEDLFYAVSLVYAELYKNNDYKEAI